MSAVNEIEKVLKNNKVFYISTIDEENPGQPRVRPFGASTVYEEKLYLVTGNYKKVYKQFLKNPRIEICSMSADRGFVRISANIVIEDNYGAKLAMLDDNAVLRSIYSADDGKMAIGYLSRGKAVFYAQDMSISKTLEF